MLPIPPTQRGLPEEVRPVVKRALLVDPSAVIGVFTSPRVEEFRNKVRSASPSIRYGLGLGIAWLSVLLRLLLNPYWGGSVPLITLYPAVVLAAWLGGFGPGVVCTLASAATASYLFFGPLSSFRVANPGEVATLIVFAGIGLLMSGIIEMLAKANDRLKDLAEKLAIEVEERTRSNETLRTVQQIVDTTIPALGLDDLLRDLLTSVRIALKSDTATVLLLQEDGVHLEPVASAGLREELEEKVAVRLGTGVSGRIALSESGLIIDDLSQVDVASIFLRKRVTSLAGVPLRTGKRLVGVMHVACILRRSFTADDLMILRLVADRVAVAVERARLQEGEHRARTASDAANQAKDRFLAIVSHDLRSPLQSILSAVGVLQSMNLPEEAGGFISRIERNTLIETRLVQDLFDVARISTGKLTLNLQTTKLGSLVEAALESVKPQFDAKNLDVQWTREGPERSLRVDPDRVQQIMTNLLTNAEKFNSSGGWIKIHLDERDSSYVELTVSDSGIGIAPELLPTLFIPFRQADTPQRRFGLGLGLVIVKSLVELHGGTVQVQSAGPGKGSTFTVKLPVVL
ncbi:MAG: hypothetical protein DMG13_23505 [Acidobacteria bacterium]|nr:MAG: hypothetical protein DMG13_23505 [Acidobacteriota bacterium]